MLSVVGRDKRYDENFPQAELSRVTLFLLKYIVRNAMTLFVHPHTKRCFLNPLLPCLKMQDTMTKAGRKIRNIKPRGWDQTLIGDNVTFLQTPKTLFFHFTAKKWLFWVKENFPSVNYTLRRKSLLYGGKVNFPSVKFTFPWKSALSLRKVNFTEEKWTFPPKSHFSSVKLLFLLQIPCRWIAS